MRKAGFLGFYKQFQNESSKQTVTKNRFAVNLLIFTLVVGWETCYPRLTNPVGFGPVRNKLRTLRRVGNLLPTIFQPWWFWPRA
jgi:hypothetical protein